MRHREAFAVEKRAPTPEQWAREQADEETAAGKSSEETEAGASARELRMERREAAAEAPRRRLAAAVGAAEEEEDLPRDVLIVVSKLKKYIRSRSDMNTSDNVISVLSDHLRRLCDQAIRQAAQDGRKTVLDRDFVGLLR
jgi:hypothetical protein